MSDVSLTCSIILCTRNRAQSLRRTLQALSTVSVPPALQAELILVDNNSSDETAEVIALAWLENMSCRSIFVPEPGLARARNAGIEAAAGEIIVFIDDDVIPAENWLRSLCAPILAGTADAVGGRVVLAPDLQRNWMTRLHRSWLAETPPWGADDGARLVGANMAITRRVLNKVPGFDVELGSGGLGFGEDTLFYEQLVQAGFKVVRANDAVVEHHFDPARLERRSWIDAAKKQGRAGAYVDYHWRHKSMPWWRLQLRRMLVSIRLGIWQARHPAQAIRREGAAACFLGRIQLLEYCRRFLYERKQERAYPQCGLRRPDSAEDPDHRKIASDIV